MDPNIENQIISKTLTIILTLLNVVVLLAWIFGWIASNVMKDNMHRKQQNVDRKFGAWVIKGPYETRVVEVERQNFFLRKIVELTTGWKWLENYEIESSQKLMHS